MRRPRLLRVRRSTATVRWLVAVVAVAAFGALAGPALVDHAAAQGRDEEAEPAEGDPDEGARRYTQQCASCHGPAGRGGEDAPSLRGIDVARVDLVLRTNRMPPANSDGTGRGPIDWQDDERADLVAYAAREFDLTGEVPRPEPGDAAVGREVYAANCAACHGYTGSGGVAGSGALVPAIAGRNAVVIAEAMRVGPFQMPRFGPRQITDEEVGDVVAYLDTVAEEEATPLLGLVELNPVYASAFVALLAIVAVVSCAWLGGRVLMFPDPAPPDDREDLPASEHEGQPPEQERQAPDEEGDES